MIIEFFNLVPKIFLENGEIT